MTLKIMQFGNSPATVIYEDTGFLPNEPVFLALTGPNPREVTVNSNENGYIRIDVNNGVKQGYYSLKATGQNSGIKKTAFYVPPLWIALAAGVGALLFFKKRR